MRHLAQSARIIMNGSTNGIHDGARPEDRTVQNHRSNVGKLNRPVQQRLFPILPATGSSSGGGDGRSCRPSRLIKAWHKTIAAAAFAFALAAHAQVGESVFQAPAAVRVAHEGPGLKTAIFSGGCFWGVEGVFSHVKGVTSAISGYRGGKLAHPTYEQVSIGATGHAESVKVTYNPSVVGYDQLLRIFFSVVADPTLKDRQGPDTGTQYRAALVPLTPEQKAVAAAYLVQMKASGVWKRPIVVQMESASTFWPAESYHQDFILRNPQQGYIVQWDLPKIAALRAMFPTMYSPTFKAG